MEDQDRGKKIQAAVSRIRYVNSFLKKDPENEYLKFSMDIELRSFENLLIRLFAERPDILKRIRQRNRDLFGSN